jgi:fatty acid amide hydrolase
MDLTGVYRKATACVLGAYGTYYLVRYFMYRRRANKVEQKARRKREAKLALKLEDLELVYVPENVKEKIISLNATQLAQAIKNKEFSCIQVMSTYIQRAFTIGRNLNLTAEEPFRQALQLAREADELLRTAPEKCGRLHGVPISIKDELYMEGCCSSGGVAWVCENPDPEDNYLVALLKKEGAIPFIRGNVPQLMMWIECENNIYGRAMNPWNHTRTTGGSSGGEAGLVSTRSAPLAIGSDIGGSIRVPSAFCGVYGFKPTPSRVTTRNTVTFNPVVEDTLGYFIPVSYGPITRGVDDMLVVLDTWWKSDLFRVDADVVPLEFNHQVYSNTLQSKLKIGYYVDDGLCTPVPSMRRAVLETVNALRHQGHECVEFSPEDVSEGYNLYIRIMEAPGAKSVMDCLQGEDPVWYYQIQSLMYYHPWIGKILMKLLQFTGFKRLSKIIQHDTDIDSYALCGLLDKLGDYRRRFLQKMQSQGLDVIICPSYGTVAHMHRNSEYTFHTIGYALLYNLLRFPAGVVPVTQVLESECYYDGDQSDWSSKILDRDMKTARGMPVAVQVISAPYKDEVVLGVMKLIESKFDFHKHPDY